MGFEPTTPGLEARCYILAKPRARYMTEILTDTGSIAVLQAASGTLCPRDVFS